MTSTLAELWKAILKTPEPDNPFGTGDDSCIELRGRVVAPFGPLGPKVRVRKVETPLIPLDLPDGDILEVPPQQALSVADGWVALLHPLHRGTHHVVIHDRETKVDGTAVDVTNDTTLIVKRR